MSLEERRHKSVMFQSPFRTRYSVFNDSVLCSLHRRSQFSLEAKAHCFRSGRLALTRPFHLQPRNSVNSCTEEEWQRIGRGASLGGSGHRSVQYADLCAAWLPVCFCPAVCVALAVACVFKTQAHCPRPERFAPRCYSALKAFPKKIQNCAAANLTTFHPPARCP